MADQCERDHITRHEVTGRAILREDATGAYHGLSACDALFRLLG